MKTEPERDAEKGKTPDNNLRLAHQHGEISDAEWAARYLSTETPLCPTSDAS